MRFQNLLYLLSGQQQLSTALPSSSTVPTTDGGAAVSSSGYEDGDGPDWDWDAAQQKARAFTAQLTLDEKVGVVTGGPALEGLGCVGNLAPVPRAGFGGLCLSDGPTGVNRADLVSVFPAGLTTAATWDRKLMYRRGRGIGEEFRAKGAHVYLGPVAGPLGRHPLGGRNWEGFSPDPYLTGAAMRATVRGVQRAGVQASAKHYVGNEQETQRSSTTDPGTGRETAAISSNIGPRTLRELYLWPFADAVRADASSIMCSYNRLGQTYACEHPEMLNEILKTELGFRGYVVSDWGATHSTSPSMNGGLDLEMPGNIAPGQPTGLTYYWGANLTQAIKDGAVSEDRLDDAVRRVVLPYFALEQDRDDFPSIDPSTAAVMAVGQGIDLGLFGIPETPAWDVRGDHAALIREIGAAGTVLLKNVNSTLPLKAPKNIGVFGNDAPDPADGLVWPANPGPHGFEIGTLDVGGGSGTVRHTNLVTPLEGIRARAKETESRVQYVSSNRRLAANDLTSIYPTPDICLVFLNTYASEGDDRRSFESDWNSTLVVNNVADRCNNTVVVTHSAGINTMPWAGHENVKAILAAHYPGEESGNSIVDVLWGDVNPSGKLPYTIPEKESDYDIPIVNLTDVPDPEAWQADFDEGLFIDYRHFDAHNFTPLYEFGFGLSYTTFDLASPVEITTLVTDPPEEPEPVSGPVSPGGNPALYEPLLRVSTGVSNAGAVAGATVVQLYVSFPQDTSPPGTPSQVLRGFEKIHLEPGSLDNISFELTRRDLSYWDEDSKVWKIPSGGFELRVGFSSRDVKETAQHAIL